MNDSERLSQSRAKKVLELGCAYNTPLSITAESRGQTYQYRSRLLEIEKASSPGYLVIDLPVADGPAIALRPRTAITLFFSLDRERFLFESRVLKKTTFDLQNRTKISALEITYPGVLKNGQRRLYYRVSVPFGKPMPAECYVIGDDTDLSAGESADRDLATREQIEGQIVNISVGGLLIALKKTDRNLLDVGTRLGLKFKLGESETLMLKAVIVRVEGMDSAEEFRVGVKFVDTDEAFESKLAINRIYRYVAERQREIIRLEAE